MTIKKFSKLGSLDALLQVHERSVQSDFLLIILKRLLDVRQDLKVILMSATIDADRFSAYFSHCPVINIPGRIYPVEVIRYEITVLRIFICKVILSDLYLKYSLMMTSKVLISAREREKNKDFVSFI